VLIVCQTAQCSLPHHQYILPRITKLKFLSETDGQQ
jgi:hypothetical protein